MILLKLTINNMKNPMIRGNNGFYNKKDLKIIKEIKVLVLFAALVIRQRGLLVFLCPNFWEILLFLKRKISPLLYQICGRSEVICEFLETLLIYVRFIIIELFALSFGYK